MNGLNLRCHALSDCVAVISLEKCGRSQPPISVPGTTPQVIGVASSYNVLHAFGGFRDGAVPCASLLDESGTLYGTTASGGQVSQRHGKSDGGSVFTDPFVREVVIGSTSSREVLF